LRRIDLKGKPINGEAKLMPPPDKKRTVLIC
jgi:hypothetical protein